MSSSSISQQKSSVARDTILKVDLINKSFPGVKALEDVSIDVREGEILAILGENGAGKSTLMKILSGLYHPDSGSIEVNREWFHSGKTQGQLENIQMTDPRMSMQLGIGMVYQHFQLVGPFTVAENIMLGKEYTSAGFIINQEVAIDQIKQMSKEYGLPIDPSALVEELPVGLKQRVEILKQLFRDAQLLILDEPTAVLTPTEVAELFKTMRKLKEGGRSLIFISHKLKEAIQIADRIVVLRRGKLVGETYPEVTNERELAEMLVGRKVLDKLDRQIMKPGATILEVNNLSLTSAEDHLKELEDINFEIHANEIVGVAGVQGNGQSELLDILVGMNREATGEINYYRDDQEINLREKTTLEILQSGIAYIPEDRNLQGLILDFDISENSWMAFHSSKKEKLNSLTDYLGPIEEVEGEEEESTLNKFISKIRKAFFLPFELMYKLADSVISRYQVQTSSSHAIMRSLSGGNQQKVLIGREFAKNPHLVIAAQPTRGVDIGVMEKVHQELITRRNNGAGILLISSDLDEVLKLSDFILVMYEGKIVGRGPIDQISISEISQLMTTGVAEKEVKQ